MAVLAERLVLVAGGAGAVGEGLTRQLLAQDAEVILISGPVRPRSSPTAPQVIVIRITKPAH